MDSQDKCRTHLLMIYLEIVQNIVIDYIAATNKSIVKNMFTQVTNPDMRLKVNKAILAGFTTKKAKGKTATTNKGKKKSPTKTKQTQKQRKPKGIVVVPVGKVDQKAGQNPLALKSYAK